MRRAATLAREALDTIAALVRPGITTDELDQALVDAAIARGCYPSPLGYHGFPKSVCTSVNEVVCHGIPDQRALQDGDLINLDVTLYHNGASDRSPRLPRRPVRSAANTAMPRTRSATRRAPTSRSCA